MKEITFKQIGLNVILVIEGEKFSKKIEAKEDREKLKAQVEAYNKKPTAKALKIIQTIMTINTVKKKEEEVIEKKVAKKIKKGEKIIKKEKKEVSQLKLLQEENEKLKKELASFKTKPMPNAAPNRSRTRG